MPNETVFEKKTDSLSVQSAVDADALQYHFVKYDVDGNLVACDTAGEASIGVLENDPNVGETGVVITGGFCRLTAGGALARGELVMTDTSARGVLATIGLRARGEVVTPAAADGDRVTIRLLDMVAP